MMANSGEQWLIVVINDTDIMDFIFRYSNMAGRKIHSLVTNPPFTLW